MDNSIVFLSSGKEAFPLKLKKQGGKRENNLDVCVPLIALHRYPVSPDRTKSPGYAYQGRVCDSRAAAGTTGGFEKDLQQSG
jgi:hypothetical protein